MRPANPRARISLLAASAFTLTSVVIAAPMLAQAGPSSGEAPDPVAQAANGPLTVRAASSLKVERLHRNVIAGKTIRVRGTLSPLTGKRPISLQVRTRKRWLTVDKDQTTADGRYSLRWRTKKVGSRRIRISFEGSAAQTAARRNLGYANVYRTAMASWYGPGLYGNALGCGGRLNVGTIGVAHKSLPCGTKLTLRYRGRTVQARVIDRGPFVAGREFDLTAATKARLGFGSTGRIMVAVH